MRTLIAINLYIRKEEKSQINQLSSQKPRKKEEQNKL